MQQSIKTKGSSIKVVGAAGANNALNQMEGGDEVKDAAMVAYGATRPVAKTISKGANLINNRLMQKQVARIKKVDAGKNLAIKKAKQSASNIAKNSSKQAAKTAAKETAKAASKETAKVIAKETTKTVASATATTVTTTAGTTISPGVGTLIGIAAGYAVGAEIEKKDGEMVRRNRMIKFFLDKMNSEDQQKDSLLKLVKDLIISKVMTKIKIVGPIVGLFFLLLALVVAITVTPVVVAVGVVYNSPFAIFFPPLEEGDTVLTVTSAYVSAFNREVSTLASEHGNGESYIHLTNGKINLIGPPFEILSEKSVKHYEKLKEKGENIYIDSLTYEEFMMLGDKDLGRRFSKLDEKEQKDIVNRELGNELEFMDDSQKSDNTSSGGTGGNSLGSRRVVPREKPAWEDTISNRMLHWNFTVEQKEEVRKAIAVGISKTKIMEYFYPDVNKKQMRDNWKM